MTANERSRGTRFHDPQKIFRRRNLAGLSQTAAARQADITPAHMCNIENGTRNPSPEVLARLAEVFNCTIEDLERDPEAEAAAEIA